MSWKLTQKSTFMLAWTIMTFYNQLIRSSEFKYILPGNLIKYVCSFCAVFLLILKLGYFDKVKKRNLLFVSVFMSIVLVVSYKAVGITLMLYSLFIIASENIQFEKIVKLDMTTRLFSISFLMLSSFIGIISSYSREINGVNKLAFGWLHPNTFCGAVIIVIIDWLYLNWDRIRIRHIAVISCAFLFLFIYSPARTTLYSSLAIIAWFLLSKKMSVILTGRIFQALYKNLMILMGMISWGMYYLYVKGTHVGIMLNEMLTTRLNWANRYMNSYGITLWGSDIETVSTREAAISGMSKQILDMSYIRLPIEYGLIYSLLFLIGYAFIIRYILKNKMWTALMVTMFFVVIGIGTTTTINLFNNYTMLLVIPAISQLRNKKYEKQGMGSGEIK